MFAGRIRRVAIWGKLTERQLASDIRELMSDLLHVPKVEQRKLIEKLRGEVRRRTRASTPGIWTSDDLLATVRTHGGFLASSASPEYFVAPANFDKLLRILNDKNAVVIRGASGTGKTQAALKLCDIARQRDGTLEVVTIGADDLPASARKVVNNGPTLFYVDDPWGQYSLRGGSETWTEQLPLLLKKATADHRFVITSRSDMMQSARVGDSLNAWSVELGVEQYRDGQLRAIHDNRMAQLPAALQTKAYAFRNQVLEELGTPLEIDLYFDQMQSGTNVKEEDHVLFRRLLKLAQREAVEGVVVKCLASMDSCGTSAIVWALLAARGQFDRAQLQALQSTLRSIDRALGDGLDHLVDRMVAARHLRQPAHTVAFAHPSVRQGFESFARAKWGQSEFAIGTLISALVRMSVTYRSWSMETAARVYEVFRKFACQQDVEQTFAVDPASQEAIDAWLDESLIDTGAKFAPLLELASEIGSDASIPSRVARWLLKGTQRGGQLFNPEWEPPIFDDAWYATVSASPVAAKVAARFVREELGVDQGNYGADFVKRLDRIAPNLTAAYLDAARQMVGSGFVLNVDIVADGAVRDLTGFYDIVHASLDNLANIHRQYAQSGLEEWRAIEDGERDHAAEESERWSHEDDGYAATAFIDTYIRQLRRVGNWQAIANHPRVTELILAWAQALQVSPTPVDESELQAILGASQHTGEERNVWSAVREHWHAVLEPALAERLRSSRLDVDLRDELTLTALKVAPNALVAMFLLYGEQPDRQVSLLTSMQRAQTRLGKSAHSKLRRVSRALRSELKEVLNALRTRKRKARVVKGSTLSLLADCASRLDPEALDFVVPVIIASGGNASPAIAQWLTTASSNEHAVSATEAAIAIGDTTLVGVALRHRRSDARRAALLHLAPTFADPLPPAILSMAYDPGSRVRRALVSLLAKRPHPDHIKTLLVLIHDIWSSAEPQYDAPDSFDIAQEAVIALAANGRLSDAIGDTLLELANTTIDRELSQRALAVAAQCCSVGLQQKIAKFVDIPQARWIRLDALDALAGADPLDPSIVALVTREFLLNSPAILAVSAAHLVGAHARVENALKVFEGVASSNNRRALLLVGANAIATRDRTTADRILDLLELDHPGRQLLKAPKPLPASILDDLGDVQLRIVVGKRLGDRIASPDNRKRRGRPKLAIH